MFPGSPSDVRNRDQLLTPNLDFAQFLELLLAVRYPVLDRIGRRRRA